MKTSLPLLSLVGALALGFVSFSSAAPEPLQISFDPAAVGNPISPDLFGIFFEDLNYAADGGLYAELIQNRSFEYRATEQANWGPLSFWDLVKTGNGDGQLRVGDSRPVHANNPHYALLTVLEPGTGVGIANPGFDGIPLQAGNAYEASFWAYQTFMGKKWSGRDTDQTKPMPVTARLESKDGAVLAEARLEVSGRAWKKYSVTLTPSRTVPDARFVLLAHAQGSLAIDMVSLFPHDTFKGHPNGLRRDLAQVIADIKPKFIRFPGGCLVHGPGIHAYYKWKDSIGPVEGRHGQRNWWGYDQTLGLGYFEYFQFCEDIGAAPLPVVTAGVCCQHGGDSPDRGQEVYAGEYAAHEPDRRNTLRSALAEAAGCIGFERNGDVVHLASYAPLLARRNHTQWTPDMIYFTGTEVYPSINYQVQRLFGHNGGDVLLPVAIKNLPSADRVALSVVRDSASGDVIVKVVNGTNEARPASIALGAAPSERHLVATVLMGASADVANEDGKTPAAVPVTEESRVGARFDRVFPANSLTVLRLR